MRRKALVAVLFSVMVLAALSIGNADAAWYTCTIRQAGSTYNYYYVQITDNNGAFTATNYIIDESYGRGKEMYAAALTAWANGSNVYVYVDNTTQYSTVWALAATN